MIWVFNGKSRGPTNFPGAVFSSRENAEKWISNNKLSGVLTAYPLDTSVYDWAISKGHFHPKKDDHKSADFIATFSSAYQPHHHYEDGSEL
jgi:hypothetical protein